MARKHLVSTVFHINQSCPDDAQELDHLSVDLRVSR